MSVAAKAVIKSIEDAGLFIENGHSKTQITMNVAFVGDDSSAHNAHIQLVIDLEDALLTVTGVHLAVRDAIINYGANTYGYTVTTGRILAFAALIL